MSSWCKDYSTGRTRARIGAHEAINAYARDIMLTAKEHFEANGWQVIHGIVDSTWVETIEGEVQINLERVARKISEAVNIRMKYEAVYD